MSGNPSPMIELRIYNMLNICGYKDTFKSWGNDIIWKTLHDLLLFVQVKKRGKHAYFY